MKRNFPGRNSLIFSTTQGDAAFTMKGLPISAR